MRSEEKSEVIQTWPTLKPTTISAAQHLILSPELPKLYTNCAIFLTVSWSFSTPNCHARGQNCTLRLLQLCFLTVSLSPLPPKSPPRFATSFHASNKVIDDHVPQRSMYRILNRSTAGLKAILPIRPFVQGIRAFERHADQPPGALHFS